LFLPPSTGSRPAPPARRTRGKIAGKTLRGTRPAARAGKKKKKKTEAEKVRFPRFVPD
jgi:hypothetical protein